jgi:hypothetical protein
MSQGIFDPSAKPLALFDETAASEGWFDGDLLQTATGGGSDVTVGLTGVAATAAVGLLGVALTLALTGAAASAAVGTASPSRTVAVTGTAGTGGVGTSAPSSAVSVSGVAGTGAVGTATTQRTVALTGSAGAGSVGTMSAGNDVAAALTGVSATASVGTLTPSSTKALTGTSATTAVGTAVVDRQLALMGVSATGAEGSIAASGSVPVADDAYEALVRDGSGDVVVYLRLADTNTTAVDSSGNANNGTYQGDGFTQAQPSATEIANASVTVSNQTTPDLDTSVQISASQVSTGIRPVVNGGSSLSIEAWVRFTADPGDFLTYPILRWASSELQVYWVTPAFSASGRGYWAVAGFVSNATPQPTGDLGVFSDTYDGNGLGTPRVDLRRGWHYIAYTWNGLDQRQSLYVDGALIVTAPTESGDVSTLHFPVGTAMLIAALYQADVDELALYKAELTAEAIAARWALRGVVSPDVTVRCTADTPVVVVAADDPVVRVRPDAGSVTI